MKVAVITSMPSEHLWRDGLYGALNKLNNDKDFFVDVFIRDSVPHSPEEYDVVIAWGAFGSTPAKYVSELSVVKKAIFFGASHGQDKPLAYKFDLIFSEDQNSHNIFKKMGLNSVLAFGTMTDLFRPIPQPVYFDAIQVGAYATWKRKKLFAEAAKGLKTLSVGDLQKVERDEYEACVSNGVLSLPNVPQEHMPFYYASAKCVVVTGWAGGQRTILEALAMNKQCIVPADAPQLLDYSENIIVVRPEADAIRKAIEKAPDTNEKGRQDVLDNWTDEHYYQSIKEGLECLK